MPHNHPKFRVVVHGVNHFCQKLPALLCSDEWDVRYHHWRSPAGLAAVVNDLRGCDLVYTWGGVACMTKFLWLARCLGVKRLVMLWAGTDALAARLRFAPRDVHPWIARQTHWAVSPWLAEEVHSLGIPCEPVQVSFVPTPAQPAPLPERFAVLVYLPNAKPNVRWLYGSDQVIEVARALPGIEFVVIGVNSEQGLEVPPNVRLHGWVNDLAPVLRRTTVLWRPVRHDGLSFMVLEALAQGRHVLYSYPFPACLRATSAAAAGHELERLFALHATGALEPNELGVQLMARDFSPESVRSELLNRWKQMILAPDSKPAAHDVRQEAWTPTASSLIKVSKR